MSGHKHLKHSLALLAALGLLSVAAASYGLEVGAAAPPFHLESGDRRTLSLDQLRGRVALILYETKDTTEENRPLKNEIAALYARSSPPGVRSAVLPVINCSSAHWPVSAVWRSRLKEHSEKEGLVIYGDWDGKMFSDYGMQDKASNVLVIDGAGVVCYFRSGRLAPGEIRLVIKLLKKLEGH